MPKITYIEHDGTSHTVEVDVGLSVMEGAIGNGIPGIEAICGGSCACATCHCYVSLDWLKRMPEIDELEVEMLSEASSDTTVNSRLSCQLEVTSEFDGLVVNLPEVQ